MSIQTKKVLPVIATVLVAALGSVYAMQASTSEMPAPSSAAQVGSDSVKFPPTAPAVKRLLTEPVKTAQATILNLPARMVWDEDHTSRVVAPIPGRLLEVPVQVGANVKAGQTLATLTSTELGSVQSEAARAQADFEQAERSYKRNKELVDAGVLPRKELEQAETDMTRSKSESQRVHLRLKTLGAADTLDQRFILRSPISGVIVERNTNPGMEWRPDQQTAPLFVVSDPSYLWCLIDAPEQALSMLRPGMQVELHASAWPQEKFTATVDYVSDALDPVSRTMKVRAKLRNPQHYLKDEMFVTAQLTAQAQGALDVPAKAVFLNKGEQQVFVKTAAGQYQRKTIQPVASNKQWVTINQGLNAGDEVVVDGALYLQRLITDAPHQPAQPATQQAAAKQEPRS